MLDLIVSWLCSAIAEAFQGFVNLVTGIFDFDITNFNNTFPYAATAYDVILDVALAVALIIAAWQAIVFFFQGADKAPSTPVRAAINTIVAVGFIYYGNYLLEMIFEFCQYPYDTLSEINGVQWDNELGSVGEGILSLISTACAQTSIVLYLILMVLICYSFVKLILEIVERYCWTFFLLYLSPLASATLASSTTSGIYKKFFTMFVSQCLLLLLNVWCLKMACSGLSLSGNEATTNIVSLLLCYACIRLSSKFDSYINQLGLNSAITGNGLGAEIIAAGATMLGAKGGSGGGSVLGAGNDKNGGFILGAAKTTAQYINRTSPVAATATAIKYSAVGATKGGSEAYRSFKFNTEKPASADSPTVPTSAGSATSMNETQSAPLSGDAAPAGASLSGAEQTPPISKATPVNAPAGSGEATTPPLGNDAHAFAPAARSSNDSVPATSSDKKTPIVQKAKAHLGAVWAGAKEGAATGFRNSDNLISQHFAADANGNDYRKQLNQELVDGKDANLQENLAAWSGNQHLAHSGFSYVQATGETVNDSDKVAAIAKGIGVGEQSKEGEEFIKVGFDQADGIPTRSFTLNEHGIHASYESQDGYRYKLDVVNQSQYDKLTTQEREGLEKFRVSDGHRYYMRTSKTKMEPVPKEKTEKTGNKN